MAAKPFSKSCSGKRCVMTGRDIQAGLQHHGHLVPGLVHLAAIDALDGEHVEDHRASSRSRISLAGMPSIAILPPWPCWRSCRERLRRCRTSPGRHRSLPSCRVLSALRPAAFRCGIDGQRRAHLLREVQPIGIQSVMTTCRAPACRTTAAAMMPIGPAPVISTSSPSTGNDSAVCTALPKGSKMAATSRIDCGSMPPDIGHRQRDVFGEGARPVHADALGVRAEMPAAGETVAAAAADDVAFAADNFAGDESR